MTVDPGNRLHVAVSLVVLAGIIVLTSLGFQVLSTNPLVPDAEFEATDAGDVYDLNRPGTVEMLTVEHTHGAAMNTTEFEVLLGSRSEGTRFNGSNNWTETPNEITLSVRLNGQPPGEVGTFGPGDRLTVAKTAGTMAYNATFEVRVRLYHIPSQQAVYDQRVEVR